jgi:hypothetical protein
MTVAAGALAHSIIAKITLGVAEIARGRGGAYDSHVGDGLIRTLLSRWPLSRAATSEFLRHTDGNLKSCCPGACSA